MFSLDRLFYHRTAGLVLLSTKPFDVTSADPLVHVTNAAIQASQNPSEYYRQPLRYTHTLDVLSQLFNQTELDQLHHQIELTIYASKNKYYITQKALGSCMHQVDVIQ
eukprot:GHVS01015846.1.p3 GENE.GHVS01015846.1~~GHVS01015846.1.p3  ORF type:complete len:108 (-),score=2.43 GHVS01015846.1:898-1221(-)